MLSKEREKVMKKINSIKNKAKQIMRIKMRNRE